MEGKIIKLDEKTVELIVVTYIHSRLLEVGYRGNSHVRLHRYESFYQPQRVDIDVNVKKMVVSNKCDRAGKEVQTALGEALELGTQFSNPVLKRASTSRRHFTTSSERFSLLWRLRLVVGLK